MVIAKAFVAILLADSSITGLVGQRITPKESPQDEPLPAIAYDCENAERDRTMNGPGSLTQQSFEIVAQATTYSGAEQLGALVRKSLDGKDGTFGGITVLDIAYEDETEDLYQVDDAGPESNIHVRTVKFRSWFYMPT